MNIIINRKTSPYEFDTDQNGFPAFTQKNIDFLNGILRYDSNYSTSSDKDNPEYQTSYAGILERGDFFNFSASVSPSEDDELGHPIDDLYRVIVSIDKINSTHLASEGNDGKKEKSKKKRNKGRARVAERIREIGGPTLKDYLEKGDAGIVNIISDSNVGGKHNFSFATKFCSYVSIHALKKDNYCIYDEILQKVLPYYAYMYIDEFDEKYGGIYKTVNPTKANDYQPHNESLVNLFKQNNDYEGYRNLIKDVINGIREKTGVAVSFEDFDHMLWYYFKGSSSKIAAAMECLPQKSTKKNSGKQR